jgi:GntR family transcriptional regulator
MEKVPSLKENTGIPLYIQVVGELSSKIASGEYLPGQRIPTESQLCREFGVSRITIRQAIRKLVAEHALYAKQGKGTFVNAVKIRRRLPRLYSFSEDMRELGFEPSSKILEQVVATADEETVGLLALPESDRLVSRISRVRKANNVPILIERSYIPHYICPDLLGQDYEHVSLYRTLTEKYRIELDSAEEIYEVRLMTLAEAKELGCKRGQPAFAIQRLALRKDGKPVELTKSIGRGDLLRFSVELITSEVRFSRNVDISTIEFPLGNPKE